jgi:2TM domain
MQMSEQELQRQARRRVNLKMGWYIHATVFVLVNLGLAALNLATGGHAWHLWPLAGWGLGLTIHGVVTWLGLQGDGLRRQMLQRELQHLQQRGPR